MLLNDLVGCVDSSLSKPVISCQLDLWFEPELGLAAGVLYVYMRSGLSSREKK